MIDYFLFFSLVQLLQTLATLCVLKNLLQGFSEVLIVVGHFLDSFL